MAIYKVIRRFDDKDGHGGVYEIDDLYLHQDRVDALSTTNNKLNKPFIKELTVAELKAKLTDLEIEFGAKAKKDELEDLLLNALVEPEEELDTEEEVEELAEPEEEE